MLELRHAVLLPVIAFAAGLAARPASAANELFGWVATPGMPGSSRLVTFDTSTGARTTIGAATPACCFVSGASALDGAGGRFFFTGNYLTETPGTDPLRLFTVSTTTGAVIDDDPLAAGFWNFLEWDATSNRLLAIVNQSSTTTLYSVDTSTGARTAIGSGVANCCLVGGNVSAIDLDGGRFFFVGRLTTDGGSDSRIFSFDTTTGALVTSPAPLMPATNNYNFLGWDPSPGILYAVVRDTVNSDEDLLTVNPTTGAVAQVGSSIADCCGVSSGVSTVDPNGNLFYFLGVRSSLGETARRLWSLDLATGAVVHNPLLLDTENYNWVEFAADPLPVELTGFTVE